MIFQNLKKTNFHQSILKVLIISFLFFIFINGFGYGCAAIIKNFLYLSGIICIQYNPLYIDNLVY